MTTEQMRAIIAIIESIEWKGTPDGSQEAQDSGHSIDDAREYLAQHYPAKKTFNLSRIEPGFRILLTKGNQFPSDVDWENPTLSPSFDHAKARELGAKATDVDAAVNQLQLKRNPMMSGSAQYSMSLGYSWHLHENPATGIALLYYQDRGMGSDSITIAAKDKLKLQKLQQMFVDAGVLPSAAERAAKAQEKLQKSLAIMKSKGLQVGSKLTDGSEITALGKTGILTITTPSGQQYKTRPGAISKSAIAR